MHRLNADDTYGTLILWLNSCVTVEQIELVKDAAEKFLLDRFGAKSRYNELCLAADNKKNLPATVTPVEPKRQ